MTVMYVVQDTHCTAVKHSLYSCKCTVCYIPVLFMGLGLGRTAQVCSKLLLKQLADASCVPYALFITRWFLPSIKFTYSSVSRPPPFPPFPASPPTRCPTSWPKFRRPAPSTRPAPPSSRRRESPILDLVQNSGDISWLIVRSPLVA
jgi:hypothetical protein